VARAGRRESRWLYYWIPQSIASVYYQLSWILYVLYPAWSHWLNADFEDHAEHEYMMLVAEHPQREQEPYTSEFEADYGSFDSLADLFRQIGHDERVHEQEKPGQDAAAPTSGEWAQYPSPSGDMTRCIDGRLTSVP
jgi:ubiquinol oxidase